MANIYKTENGRWDGVKKMKKIFVVVLVLGLLTGVCCATVSGEFGDTSDPSPCGGAGGGGAMPGLIGEIIPYGGCDPGNGVSG